MKKVRVGIVGCGWFGNFHLTNLLQMEGVCVAALAAGNETKLAETAARVPDAALYQSGEEMLEKEPLDAVILCVTPARHEDLERCAAKHGVAIYVEKPIGLSNQQVQETADGLAKTSVITSVGYQERYNPAVKQVKNYLKEHPAGLVYARWIGGMPGAEWWRNKAQSGGQMVEQTTHLFDMLRYLFGEVQSVYAVAASNAVFELPVHDVEDASVALLQFENGVIAQVASGCFVNAEAASDVGFTIYTQEARIDYAWNKTLTWQMQTETRIEPIQRNAHAEAMAVFIEAVRKQDGASIQSSYADGAKSLAISLAAEESLRTGLPQML